MEARKVWSFWIVEKGVLQSLIQDNFGSLMFQGITYLVDVKGGNDCTIDGEIMKTNIWIASNKNPLQVPLFIAAGIAVSWFIPIGLQQVSIGSEEFVAIYSEDIITTFYLEKTDLKMWKVYYSGTHPVFRNEQMIQSGSGIELFDTLCIDGLILRLLPSGWEVRGVGSYQILLEDLVWQQPFHFETTGDYQIQIIAAGKYQLKGFTMQEPHLEKEQIIRTALMPISAVILLFLTENIQQSFLITMLTTGLSIVGMFLSLYYAVRKYRKQKQKYFGQHTRMLLENHRVLHEYLLATNSYNLQLERKFIKLTEIYTGNIFLHAAVFSHTNQDDKDMSWRIGTSMECSVHGLEFSEHYVDHEGLQFLIHKKQCRVYTLPMHGQHCFIAAETEQVLLFASSFYQIRYYHAPHSYQLWIVCTTEIRKKLHECAPYLFLGLPSGSVQLMNIDTVSQQEQEQWMNAYRQMLRAPNQKSITALFVSDPMYYQQIMQDEEPGIVTHLAWCFVTMRTQVPRMVQQLVDATQYPQLTCLLKEGKQVTELFIADPLPDITWQSTFVGYLGNCSYRNTTDANEIPKSVHLGDCYRVDIFSVEAIQRQWQGAAIWERMCTVLGMGADNHVITLNLHENADGPHGLIAGMTGSGKSILIQGMLVSLLLAYPPEQLGFLFIDFKGGGLANQFQLFPHHLGTITNLDGGSISRSLELLHAEVQKRQALLATHSMTHMHQYQALQHLDVYMPTLLIVVDEFAELREQHPDFLQALISIARIGRSLAIHLLLATQKPSGIINDQIWSNSKYKICLKVESIGDAKEVVRSEEPAHFIHPGRALLKSGGTGKLTTFQTANTMDDYRKSKAEKCVVRSIHGLQRKPLIKVEQAEQVPFLSRLRSIVEIVMQGRKTYPIGTFFCPELPEAYVPQVDNSSHERPFVCIDYPKQQVQKELTISDLGRAHVLFTGHPQFGVLETIIMLLVDKIVSGPEIIEIVMISHNEIGDNLFADLPQIVYNVKLGDKDAVEHMKAVENYLDNSQISTKNKICLVCIVQLELMQHQRYYHLLQELLQRIGNQSYHMPIQMFVHSAEIQKVHANVISLCPQRFAYYEPSIKDYYGFTRETQKLMQKQRFRAIYWDEEATFACQMRQFHVTYAKHRKILSLYLQQCQKMQTSYTREADKVLQEKSNKQVLDLKKIPSISYYDFLELSEIDGYIQDVLKKGHHHILFFSQVNIPKSFCESVNHYQTIEQQVVILEQLLQESVADIKSKHIVCIFHEISRLELVKHLTGQQYIQQLIREHILKEIRLIFFATNKTTCGNEQLHPLEHWIQQHSNLNKTGGEQTT